MSPESLLLPILLPVAAAILVLLARRQLGFALPVLAILATAANLAVAIQLFQVAHAGKEISFATAYWAGLGIDFSLRLYPFSAFILLAIEGFAALIALYCWKFMKGHAHANQFYAYFLLTVAMAGGAVLADHLVALLFFWEALLLTLYGMIAIGRSGAWKTAIKAFIIVGVCDLCMMVGIALVGWQAHSLTISQIHLPVTGLGGLAMVLMIIGAISKAGSMPFHSWIPDAATDAPLPFMALLPGCFEKLVGIYFLARICLDIFALTAQAWVSMLLMIVGAATILLAVAMALVQKDYKRLLSYHAISQVGYMVLGIGTATPIGIVGGLFHMLNNAMYKSTLFLTGGAVQKQAGTTDLHKLGGLARNMPVTFACFAVTALSISGVPPFNGFFSKELVYDGALARGGATGVIFYLAALLGSFLTAASFLKLGHAAYLGRRDPANDGVKEAPLSMLAPMAVVAVLCFVFGVHNSLPIDNLIAPAMSGSHFAAAHPAGEHHFAGWPESPTLVLLTLLVLAAALANHLIGAKRSGSGLGAVDHIHHAPVLSRIYDKAERGRFDPYNLGMKLIGVIANVGWVLDRINDWIFDGLSVGLARFTSAIIRLLHTGRYSWYMIWSLIAATVVIVFLVRSA